MVIKHLQFFQHLGVGFSAHCHFLVRAVEHDFMGSTDRVDGAGGQQKQEKSQDEKKNGKRFFYPHIEHRFMQHGQILCCMAMKLQLIR
jgi:hypothetical protein